MVAANGSAVAVSCDDDDVQLRACEFNAGCERNGSSVRCMHRVEIHIARAARGTADAGDNDGVVLRKALRFLNRLGNALQCRAVAAAGTPEMGQTVLTKILLKAAVDLRACIHVRAHARTSSLI